MSQLEIKSIKRIPYAQDEEPGMPSFRVEMDWVGNPCVYEVSLEIDGREADWLHVEGADPYHNDEDFLDFEQDVYEAIHDTPEWEEAEAEYG